MAKQVKAWGIRRREVDIHQLALAYYLLARIRIDQQRQTNSATPPNAQPGSPRANGEAA
jgi:hypothetical protein